MEIENIPTTMWNAMINDKGQLMINGYSQCTFEGILIIFELQENCVLGLVYWGKCPFYRTEAKANNG